MAKPNFGFQKRQKEQLREQKRKEKQQRKLDRANEAAKADAAGAVEPGESAEGEPAR